MTHVKFDIVWLVTQTQDPKKHNHYGFWKCCANSSLRINYSRCRCTRMFWYWYYYIQKRFGPFYQRHCIVQCLWFLLKTDERDNFSNQTVLTLNFRLYFYLGIDSEEFYETQMVWKTQIKKRFESLRLQGPSTYLHKHNQQNEELSQQRLEELRLDFISHRNVTSNVSSDSETRSLVSNRMRRSYFSSLVRDLIRIGRNSHGNIWLCYCLNPPNILITARINVY